MGTPHVDGSRWEQGCELGTGHVRRGLSPRPPAGLCQPGTVSVKPLRFGVFAGILVKQKEIILDYICEAGLGSC